MKIKRHIKRRVEVTAKEVWGLLAAKYDLATDGESYFETDPGVSDSIVLLNEATSEQEIEP